MTNTDHNQLPEPLIPQWELVAAKMVEGTPIPPGRGLVRLAVPGGWLYSDLGGGDSMTFVPDDSHREVYCQYLEHIEDCLESIRKYGVNQIS